MATEQALFADVDRMIAVPMRPRAARPGEAAYVGVDPGVTGAVVTIWPDGSVEFWDLPTVDVKGRKELLTAAMGQYAKELVERASSNGWTVRATIEKPLPPRKIPEKDAEGNITGWTERGSFAIAVLFDVVGQWKMALTMLEVPFTIVTPLKWMNAMLEGFPRTDKGASIVRAQQTYPAAAKYLTRKKDHNRAQALLIADWLRITSRLDAEFDF